ncbi:hypothetical protein MAM1_0028c02255 [Mucor ambiguus]|uniref:CUE domain-containing protein n=1 Tax=Mucor ambiguus TaxID=91626 RepID=A0A0C9MLU8_9FUNG|nr:hypothetical protein MAM1_0028c02255 [Mucor ambiguus]
MENPFQSTAIDTLKEAFPTIDASIINDVLYSAQGDLSIAFDMLLDMSSPSINDSRAKPLPHAPSLPVRRSSSINSISYSCSTSNANNQPHAGRISQTNPFLVPGVAKPLTVREELAQWRQDLREESRQRATAAMASSSASTPNLSFSNMFKSNATRASLNHSKAPFEPSQETNSRHNILERNHRSSHTLARASYQRPLPPKPPGSLSGIRSSVSTPNVNYQSHSQSNSHPNGSLTPLGRLPDLQSTTNVSHRPELPSRRQSTTNPFHVSPVPPSTTQQQPHHEQLPPQQNHLPNNSNHRSVSEHDTPSFNPFEEPELPPPAYSEIQRDTIINLT